jgi:hypothetical protein
MVSGLTKKDDKSIQMPNESNCCYDFISIGLDGMKLRAPLRPALVPGRI